VVLTANTTAGLFYATQTLLQLLPPDVESPVSVAGRAWPVPVVQITDYPRFGWRGLMLDVSRHFFTVAEVYWSPKSARDWPGFIPRMEAQFVRHVNYSRAAYDAVIRATGQDGALFVALDPQIPGLTTYYSFDGSVPGHYSSVYTTGPIAVPDGPVTLRVITWRDGQPAGRLLTVKRDELQRRVKKL
jgi:N-acetyl-beta-hexosaminidase